MPRLCPAPSRCLPAPRSISSLRRLRSCLTPFRGHPLISSVPPGPACRREALLAALPGGSGMPAPREGSQRHLRLTRPTSPRARGRGKQASRGGSEPRVPTASGHRGCLQAALPSARTGRCLPPHPRAVKRRRGEGPFAHAPPRGRSKPLKLSRACPGGGWAHTAQGNRPAAAGGQHFGNSPSASIPRPRRSSHPPKRRRMGHVSMSSRLSLAPGWWEGAGKRSSAACTTSLNQHQTSTEAPAATVTSQCSQFGTLLRTMALNSQLSGVSHTSSLPGPEEAARHQDRLRQSQRNAWAPSRRELLSRRGCLSSGQGQAPSHPSVASPVAGTVSHPGHEPLTSFFSLWSQDSDFAGKFGKSK